MLDVIDDGVVSVVPAAITVIIDDPGTAGDDVPSVGTPGESLSATVHPRSLVAQPVEMRVLLFSWIQHDFVLNCRLHLLIYMIIIKLLQQLMVKLHW